MSTVETAFKKQYENNIKLLVQQRTTKLRSTVMVDTNFVGEFKFYDQLGADEMEERVSRNQDTPINQPDHQRRRLSVRDFVHNKLLDKQDELRMIIDPKSSYSISAGMAAGRQMDDVIINAFNATAYSGKEGATPETFAAANQIAAGGTGMTKAKVIATKLILDNNDVEESDRFMVISPNQLANMLGTLEVASSDYNSVKALVQGDFDTWLGFKWIKLTRLGVDGAAARLCYAYHKGAIQLGIQQEPSAKIDVRPDKNYATQVYFDMSINATRLEEERIVEIACVE